jgi:dTDP-glucose pyrophosphorylase
MKDWHRVAISVTTSLEDAILRIDETASQIALVVDDEGHLVGVLTDGDIRRAILRGRLLSSPVTEVMNVNSTVAPANLSREKILAMMRRHVIRHLPLIDDQGRVIDLVTLDDLIGVVERPNWVVLMAGGLGTRLHPLTEDRPKPMLPVGGRPILQRILESFVEQGFRHFFLSVNYKADIVKEYFGRGEKWGVRIDYLHEDRRLGTAGALSLLPSRPERPLVVMNGDLLTRAPFDQIVQFHDLHSTLATMVVREYDFQVPYGVVRLDGTKIRAIEEKPVQKFFVNAGIYVLSPDALNLIPAGGEYFDMPTLFERLAFMGSTTTAYPLREYWLDIGRIEEFERAQREWAGVEV